MSFIKIEPHLYARQGKRVTSYFTQTNGEYIPLGRDLEKAREKLNQLLGKVVIGDTIEAMCEGFIKDQKAMRKAGDETALSELSIRQYEAMLARVCKVFGPMSPREFKPMHKAQYLAMRKKGAPEKGIKPAPTGANREMAALGSAFNYGMQEGLVEENPCHGVRRNKESPRQRKPEISELNAFLELAHSLGGQTWMIALIGCAVGITGRRRAELIRQTKAAITGEGLRCKDAKTKPGEPERFYLVKWSPILRQIIEHAQAGQTNKTSIYLFPARHGGPYKDEGFSTGWNRLQRKWEEKGHERFRAHDLRALYVSELTEQGKDPNTHKNKATQQRVYDRRRTIKVTPMA